MASKYRNEGRFPKIRRVMQISESHCGPATLRMMFNHLGVKFFQREIVQGAQVAKRLKEHGMSLADIVMAVRNLAPGFEIWYKEDTSFSDLDKIVNEIKHPVGVEYQGIFEDVDEDEDEEDEDSGHYSLVTGIDLEKRKLWMANPYHLYAGQDVVFSFTEFAKRWWDDNELEGEGGKVFSVEDHRLMFVLVRTGETWPAELGMRQGDVWLTLGSQHNAD